MSALEESIKHWERMRDDPFCGDEPFSDHCALCQEYIVDDDEIGCSNCPVYKKTGKHDCEGSPFYRANSLWRDLYDDPENTGIMELFKEAAQEEIDFLKSLEKP